LGAANDVPRHARSILVWAKADLGQQQGEGIPVSSVTGRGLAELSRLLVTMAREMLPVADELALDRRQHDLVVEAHEALGRALMITDPVLIAEELRIARHAIDRISGRAGVEDLLDALFGRFCLGK